MTLHSDDSSLPAFFVLVVAAGKGERLGGSIPKQYQYLNGISLLARSLAPFKALPTLKDIRVAIHPDHHALYEAATAGLALSPSLEGGDTRQETVSKALSAWADLKDDDIVLIHDAARPFVTVNDIRKLLRALTKIRAASLVCKVHQTLRGISFESTLGEAIDRNAVMMMQTPQGFRAGDLRRAHAHMDKNAAQATDDTLALSGIGIDVTAVEGASTNIKITTAEDWAMALNMTAHAIETRIGSGFDVHAFSDEPGRKLILGGIEIPHTRGLKGHSDADVALHALTDALLGAMAAGDIGQHFPPSNPAYKNMASDVFLNKALEILNAQNARIVNIDLTIICEEPKIGPHREAMQNQIAKLCAVAPHRVSVKATTTEQLGFTGRREGIAAQAIASIEIPKC